MSSYLLAPLVRRWLALHRSRFFSAKGFHKRSVRIFFSAKSEEAFCMLGANEGVIELTVMTA
jgi:hypothetical protein